MEQHKWIVVERHWMHIWKVGYKPCANCRADSRFVASRLDADGNVVSQELFCPYHAPQATESRASSGEIADIASDLQLHLGGAYSVTFEDSNAIDDDESVSRGEE